MLFIRHHSALGVVVRGRKVYEEDLIPMIDRALAKYPEVKDMESVAAQEGGYLL